MLIVVRWYSMDSLVLVIFLVVLAVCLIGIMIGVLIWSARNGNPFWKGNDDDFADTQAARNSI